jgi:hypothetical protein
MTKVPDGLNNRQDNLRLGTGIVVRLGGKSIRRSRTTDSRRDTQLRREGIIHRNLPAVG